MLQFNSATPLLIYTDSIPASFTATEINMPLLSAYYKPRIGWVLLRQEKKKTLYTIALTHIKEANSQNPKIERKVRNKKGNGGQGC